jgi:hypothetical protein
MIDLPTCTFLLKRVGMELQLKCNMRGAEVRIETTFHIL